MTRTQALSVGVGVAAVLVVAVLVRPTTVTIPLKFSGSDCKPASKPTGMKVERRGRVIWEITNADCNDAIRICMTSWRDTESGSSSDELGPAEDEDGSGGGPKQKHCTNVTVGGTDTIRGKIRNDARFGEWYYDVKRAVGTGSLDKVDPMIDIVRFNFYGIFSF